MQSRSASLGAVVFCHIVVSLYASPFVCDGIVAEETNRRSKLSTGSDSITVLDSIPQLKTIVVTASRSPRELFRTPSSVITQQGTAIEHGAAARTIPDAVAAAPGVNIQRTSSGQGSPFLRGFTGFRTLLLVDNIRVNNSVFRDGPNQYLCTIDPFMIDRIEVAMGPGSTMYGSDAVGGVVNMLTTPISNSAGLSKPRARAYSRYSTADNSSLNHLESRIGSGRCAISGGATLGRFGDLRAGGNTGVQSKTGYDIHSADLKASAQFRVHDEFVVAFQTLTQEDVWRTHKTIYGFSWNGTDVGSDLRHLFDQSRRLWYGRYTMRSGAPTIKEVQATLSYHRQKEDRRRLRSGNRYDEQGFKVGTLGVSLQAEGDVDGLAIVCGGEGYLDNVDSYRRSFIGEDGPLVSTGIQGPVGDDATYGQYSLYIDATADLSSRFSLNFGTRLSHYRCNAERVEDPQSGEPYSIRKNWTGVTSHLRSSYYPDGGQRWHCYVSVGQSFRAPNLSDLTRFDVARSNEVETPTAALSPERYTTLETGIKLRNRSSWASVGLYYTFIRKMIVRTPTGRQIDGAWEVTKTNSGNGYVYGLELSATHNFHESWSTTLAYGVLDGEVAVYPDTDAMAVDEPLDRMPPQKLRVSLDYHPQRNGLSIGVTTELVAAQRELSTRDEEDTQRIPPDGTPGYAVFGVVTTYKISPGLLAGARLGNILDRSYRTHGSGLNEPGRDFSIFLDASI